MSPLSPSEFSLTLWRDFCGSCWGGKGRGYGSWKGVCFAQVAEPVSSLAHSPPSPLFSWLAPGCGTAGKVGPLGSPSKRRLGSSLFSPLPNHDLTPLLARPHSTQANADPLDLNFQHPLLPTSPFKTTTTMVSRHFWVSHKEGRTRVRARADFRCCPSFFPFLSLRLEDLEEPALECRVVA